MIPPVLLAGVFLGALYIYGGGAVHLVKKGGHAIGHATKHVVVRIVKGEPKK